MAKTGQRRRRTEESLLRRICGNELLFEDIRPYTKAIRRLVGDDGQVLGRASLLPSRVINNSHHDGVGVVTTKGATACFGAFCGVMVGVPTRASRDGADFVAEPHILRSWAADQAKIFSLLLEGKRQAEVAEYVAALGADTTDLKVCEIGGNYLSLPELGSLVSYLSKKERFGSHRMLVLEVCTGMTVAISSIVVQMN